MKAKKWTAGCLALALIAALLPGAGTRLAATGDSELKITLKWGVMVPADFTPQIHEYTVYVSNERTSLEFSVVPPPGSTFEVTGPSAIEENSIAVYRVHVTGADGTTEVYAFNAVRVSNPDRFSDPAQVDRICASLTPGSSVAFYSQIVSVPPRIIATLCEAEGASLSLINDIGTIVLLPSPTAEIPETTVNLTLSEWRQDDIEGIPVLETGAAVFSTVHSGRLYGEVIYRLPCSITGSFHVYWFDQSTGELVRLARSIKSVQGEAVFRCDMGGVFILSPKELAGAADSPFIDANVDSGSAGDPGGLQFWLIMSCVCALTLILGLFMGSRKGQKIRREREALTDDFFR